jgi:hypothetical protein
MEFRSVPAKIGEHVLAKGMVLPWQTALQRFSNKITKISTHGVIVNTS